MTIKKEIIHLCREKNNRKIQFQTHNNTPNFYQLKKRKQHFGCKVISGFYWCVNCKYYEKITLYKKKKTTTTGYTVEYCMRVCMHFQVENRPIHAT